MSFTRILRVLASLAILAALSFPSLALANGKPIQIVLSYLPNISNTGSQDATGIAELVMSEGEARARATGLTRLDPPQRYEAWLVNSSTNAFFALGQFNTAYTTGVASLDRVLPDAIPDRGWNLFLITIEDGPNPTQPSTRHSIAGFFPAPGTEVQPSVLPNTGGPVASQPAAAPNRPDWPTIAGLAALTLIVGAAAGYALGQRGRRRPSAARR